jgi:prepilin-type N-terminal cleavage/methylation domain-containing protein
MTKSRTNGFTLIEMLTVIVIVGIMLAFTIPAVTNLMKSTGVSTATRHVSNTLGLARQLAITQRIYARVVFPYSLSGNPQEKWYRTYAVMTNRDNSAAAVLNWRYASKWEYLPVGVVFLKTVPGGGLGALNDLISLNRELGLPFPDASGTFGQLAYIEFNPTGAAKASAGAGGDSVLVITEGFVNSPSPPTLTSMASVNALANASTTTVSSLVGRIQVARP